MSESMRKHLKKQKKNYRANSPFLKASTGESKLAFLAGIAAAKTASTTGKIRAIAIVNQLINKPILS
jgi:basic membrane lipoprotein Med (substrate-binding protein (PBP1-ABC) superfamily)